MKFGKNLRPCVPNFSGPYREFILNDMLINMDGNTLNGQLTSEVVTCLVEH